MYEHVRAEEEGRVGSEPFARGLAAAATEPGIAITK